MACARRALAVKAGIDNDPTCRYAFETNNTGATFVCKDVRDIKLADIQPYYETAEVTALVGCAPCQRFSAHNRRTKPSDADCSLVNEFARIVNDVTPDLVSMENVPGLAKHSAFDDLIALLKDLDYEVGPTDVVSCERYGVPQPRRRLVLLASRRGPISLPVSNSAPPTVRDYIHDMPPIADGEVCEDDPAHAAMPLTPTNRERIAQSKPGGSWEDWEDRLLNQCHRNAHYPAAYGRMSWDDLAPTITTQFCYYSTGRFGHPEQNRAISVREGALLQTFPRGYLLVDENDPLTIRDLSAACRQRCPCHSLATAIGAAFLESANGT